MNIYLIGFMACGKTTIGKSLSQMLSYEFIDLDDMIQDLANLSIPDIFKNLGEPVFREYEKKAIEFTFNKENIIISTGGGAPCFFDNIDKINQHGLSIFIDVPAYILAQRIKNDPTPRPLAMGKSDEELISFINSKLSERRPFYNKAKYTIKTGNLEIPELVSKIAEIVNFQS